MLMLRSLEVSQVLCLDTFKSHHKVEVLRKQAEQFLFLKTIRCLDSFCGVVGTFQELG